MQITIEMVDELNEQLLAKGCMFQYELLSPIDGVPAIKIAPIRDTFLKSCILNISDEGRQFVSRFFDRRGIALNCNNDGSILWSADIN